MLKCSIGALVCSLGVGMAQGDMVQYIFEGQLTESPIDDRVPGGNLWSWTIWVDTDTDPASVSDYSARYEGFYSELTVGSLMIEGTADLFFTNDNPTPDFSIDYLGAKFAEVPDGFSEPFRFDAGLIGEGFQLIDSLDLLTTPTVISGSSIDTYRMHHMGNTYQGDTGTNSIRVLPVPAPGAMGLLATAGVVGARRRR